MALGRNSRSCSGVNAVYHRQVSLLVVTLHKRGFLICPNRVLLLCFHFSTSTHCLQFDVWSSSNSWVLNKTCVDSHMAVMRSCMACVPHKECLAERVSGHIQSPHIETLLPMAVSALSTPSPSFSKNTPVVFCWI